MRALLPFSILASIAATGSVAHADNGVGVLVTGDATVQPQLTAHIEGWLKQRGHVLAPGALPSDALTTLIDCFVIEDLGCARKVVEDKATAPNLVFAKAELTETSGSRDLTIVAYWFERDMEAIAIRRSCEACTDDKLRTTANELMTALAGKGRAEVGQITLTSTPAGARVVIDGREVGVTPMTYSLPTGNHEVEVRHPSGATSRSVAIKTGEMAEVDVVLEGPKRPSRAVPYGVLAGGGALVLLGATLVAIDEDDTGEKYEYRDSAPWGVAIGVAGLAAVGAGAWLLMRGGSSEASPQVGFVPGGATVGWGRSW